MTENATDTANIASGTYIGSGTADIAGGTPKLDTPPSDTNSGSGNDDGSGSGSDNNSGGNDNGNNDNDNASDTLTIEQQELRNGGAAVASGTDIHWNDNSTPEDILDRQ